MKMEKKKLSKQEILETLNGIEKKYNEMKSELNGFAESPRFFDALKNIITDGMILEKRNYRACILKQNIEKAVDSTNIYNIFCCGKNSDSIKIKKQKPYIAFNAFVSKKRYYEIKKEIDRILKSDKKSLDLQNFWNSVTPEQWQQLLAIPEAKDFKEGFEFIAGVSIC